MFFYFNVLKWIKMLYTHETSRLLRLCLIEVSVSSYVLLARGIYKLGLNQAGVVGPTVPELAVAFCTI